MSGPFIYRNVGTALDHSCLLTSRLRRWEIIGSWGERMVLHPFHCLCWRFLFDFRSTTMIDMLSELFLPYAISVRLSATDCAGVSSAIINLRRRLRRRRATSPTSSFDITSQSPSLAKIKHSSSSHLVVKVISGTGIIHGRKYRSPEHTH